jgi:hypothetical protein
MTMHDPIPVQKVALETLITTVEIIQKIIVQIAVDLGNQT